MIFINYIYIYTCEIFTKISFLTTQSIANIIKLTPSYISKNKSLTSSTNNLINNNNKNNKNNKNININNNKILKNCVYEYNIEHNHDCDWGWFVEIDDVNVKR